MSASLSYLDIIPPSFTIPHPRFPQWYTPDTHLRRMPSLPPATILLSFQAICHPGIVGCRYHPVSSAVIREGRDGRSFRRWEWDRRSSGGRIEVDSVYDERISKKMNDPEGEHTG